VSRAGALGAGGLLAALLAMPPAADAQWYVASFTGGNVTRPATVTLDQPGQPRHLEFHDVRFEARPLQSPQYYGARIGRKLGRRLGVEFEFLHLKVLARTGDTVRVSGAVAGAAVETTLPMDLVVQRHAMTHGLNFFLGNVLWRTPLSRRADVVLRGGAGPVMPGVDSVVDHLSTQGYQYGGWGAHAAAGLDFRIRGPLSATLEYKLTAARPKVDVAGGSAWMTAVSHHVAAGIAIGFAR
jgi:hypothetical protein